MKLATMALVSAVALSGSIGLAQAAGPAGGGTPGGTTTTAPPAATPPSATTGQAKPGAMGDPSGAATNPSGNSLINTSPSGSTLDQTGTSTGSRR
jgi:hypothetical protein